MSGSEAPTNVRHKVIAVCSLMSVLLYLDRFCVSFAETYIKEDLGLSEFAVSLMFSTFFFTYALGQPASGWLADRFGGRRMLTIYIFSWSLCTALVGLANGVLMLVALRLGLGLAQAGAYPTAATLIAKWAPLTHRGRASSLVGLGGRLGGVMSLYITGYVILFFTPVSISSRLAPGDVLRPHALSYQVLYGSRDANSGSGEGGIQSAVGKKLVDAFPSELRGRLETAAEEFRQQELKRKENPESAVAVLPDANELQRELADSINGILERPNFFSRSELEDVKLEREAKDLLRADQSQLGDNEVTRLNRLVLEAVYPGSIKRIYCAGWRKMMLLYGAIGLPMTLLFWIVCRDRPREHPGCNEAELELIERGRTESQTDTKRVGSLPLLELMASLSMWYNGAMQFFTNVGWVLLLTYAPRYFIDVHSAPVTQRTVMTAIPAFAACIGTFLGGRFTDPAVNWWGPRWGRSLPIAITRFAAGLTYLICLLHPSPWTAVVVLSLTSFLCDLGIPAVWALQQDVGGKHSGSVLGWGNMWGNFGAVAGSHMIGQILGRTNSWDLLFVVCAGAFVVSGLVSLGIDATKSLKPEEPAN